MESTVTLVNPAADLNIRVSPKGTQFVTARNLHAALQLNPTNYSRDVKRWLEDEYAFADDLRQPIEGQEYSLLAKPVSQGAEAHHSSHGTSGPNVAQDYFIRLSLAKHITLASKSPVRKLYVRYLLGLEQQVVDADLLSPQQIVALIEVVKVMGLVSCQVSAEQDHYAAYLSKGGKYYKWWQHRAELLGFNTETLRDAMLRVGRTAARKNHREMLMATDKFQNVRVGVMDLFAALGKTDRYSQNMGELAYRFASEMKVAIWDDRGLSIDFTQGLDQDLIQEVKTLTKKGYLGLW